MVVKIISAVFSNYNLRYHFCISAVFLRENSFILILRSCPGGSERQRTRQAEGRGASIYSVGSGFSSASVFDRIELPPESRRKFAGRSCLKNPGISDGKTGRIFFGKDVGRMYRSYLILQMDIWYIDIYVYKIFGMYGQKSNPYTHTFTNTLNNNCQPLSDHSNGVNKFLFRKTSRDSQLEQILWMYEKWRSGTTPPPKFDE